MHDVINCEVRYLANRQAAAIVSAVVECANDLGKSISSVGPGELG
jgi:hypothetical protein